MKTIDKKVLELKKSLLVFPDYSSDFDQMPSLKLKYGALSIKIDKTVDDLSKENDTRKLYLNSKSSSNDQLPYPLF